MEIWLTLLQVNMGGRGPSIRMRNSIFAKEVTSWRRGKVDDDDDDDDDDNDEEEEEDDEEDDCAAGDGRRVAALVDADV